MANKVHPQSLIPTPNYFTSKQETFTIWMKSLVLSGNGCTVFDSNGQVVYRVDNYNRKGCNQVHLMDSNGQILFTLHKKKYKLLDSWEGYRASGDEIDRKKPGFEVKRSLRISGHACQAIIKYSDENQNQQYSIESNWKGKSTCRVVDKAGVLIAEVKRKQSKGGVVLGEDVLTMVVEPSMDHSLVTSLLLVYNLIVSRI